jgi:hypothetical protein
MVWEGIGRILSLVKQLREPLVVLLLHDAEGQIVLDLVRTIEILDTCLDFSGSPHCEALELTSVAKAAK